MRLIFSLMALLAMTPLAAAQLVVKEERRFGVLLTAELYPQQTPKQTMTSLIRALDKERYDYLVAHLLDPAYAAEQLQITAAEFDKLAQEKAAQEKLDKKGFDPEMIRNRVRQLSTQENFANLVRRVKAKLDEDPVAVNELRRLAREGEIAEAGETALVKHKDVKDRTLFLRNVNGRWYLQNKTQE